VTIMSMQANSAAKRMEILLAVLMLLAKGIALG
jgi:hypothetical protein